VLTWALFTNLNLGKATGLLTSLLIFGNAIKLYRFFKSTLQFIKINSKITGLEESNIIFKMY